MTRPRWFGLLVAALFVAGCVSPGVGAPGRPGGNRGEKTLEPDGVAVSSAQPGSRPTGRTENAEVVRVADGDTIVVEIGSVEARVRYIGIDTPETDIADAPNEWMAADAARANSDLVNARQVVLEMDVSQTDRFGRLLRYVWVREGGEWTMVNRELLRLGFARVTTYPPDVKYANVFRKAEAWARKKERGLWSAPTQEVVPNTMPLPLVPQSQPEQPRTGCDRSYPDVCIPLRPRT